MFGSIGTTPQSKYDDAYTVANRIIGFGTSLKVIGIVGACGIVALAFLDTGVPAPVETRVIAGALVGSLWWSFFYGRGVMVCAQGQLLSATLDTAVNTSVLIDTVKETSSRQEVTVAAAVSDAGASRHLLYCAKCQTSSMVARNENLCPKCGRRAE